MTVEYKKTNEKLDNFLIEGKRYRVLEIECLIHSGIYFRVLSEDDVPILANNKYFELKDYLTPINWGISFQNQLGITIGPKNWLIEQWKKIGENSFWEDYFDGKDIALGYFKKEVYIIKNNS